MTSCIAAVGTNDNGKHIVFATDRMITRPSLGEFESQFRKHYIFENCVVMIAGVPNHFQEIRNTLQKGKTCSEQATLLHEKLKNLRRKQVEDRILSNFDLKWEDFKELIKAEKVNAVVEVLYSKIAEERLGVQLILAGFDGIDPKLFVISELGISPETEMGYCAIGEGQLQAINTFMFSKHYEGTNLKEAIYNVFKAKKNSEVAIGVGTVTDFGILNSEGASYSLKNESEELKKIFEKEKENWKQYECLKKFEEDFYA